MSELPPALAGLDPVRCLGRGAHGQVWLMSAHDGSVNVVAKFLETVSELPESDADRNSGRHNESQITQEWRFLTQFRHEHLMRVYPPMQDSDGAFVLLMDYAAGGSLAQIVGTKGPLSVGETVTVLTPLGQVLAFLHGRGAVHGDVSPGNVLLSVEGKPLLADFGFGRLLGQAAGSLAGTAGFYCPTDTVRDAASDVYSLAAVGWFALTGRTAPPTRERLPLGTFVKEIPPELIAALEAGLDENPVNRPTAAAFAQAVFRSARAEPVALGNAVHPSVLPDLLTRKDVSVRRGNAGPGRILRRFSLPHKPYATARPGSRGSHAPVQRQPSGIRVPSLRWLRERYEQRRARKLGRMWGSPAGGSPPFWTRGHTKAVAVALTVLVMACGGIVAVQGGWIAGGGWHSFKVADSKPVNTVNTTGGSSPTELERSLAWATALPAQIREGLAAQDPMTALHALAWVRSYALSNADVALVESINVAGSPSLEQDLAIVQSLKNHGHTFTGLETGISNTSTDYGQEARPASDSGSATDPPRATVRATVTTSTFAEQDEAGTLVHTEAGEHVQDLEIVLVKVASRWQIQEILTAPSP